MVDSGEHMCRYGRVEKFTYEDSSASITPMQNFDTRKLAILAGGSLVAFSLMYWVFDSTLGYAIGITVVYAIIALVAMYFKGRSSS